MTGIGTPSIHSKIPRPMIVLLKKANVGNSLITDNSRCGSFTTSALKLCASGRDKSEGHA